MSLMSHTRNFLATDFIEPVAILKNVFTCVSSKKNKPKQKNPTVIL